MTKRPQSIFADPHPFRYATRLEQQRLLRVVRLATGRTYRMLDAEAYRVPCECAECDACLERAEREQQEGE